MNGLFYPMIGFLLGDKAAMTDSVGVYIKTLGCKVNSYDSAMLEKDFQKCGYHMVSTPEQADLVLINSCSVTSTAEKETRYLLRKFNRDNPNSFKVVTGCYAQINSGSLSELETLDFVVPNQQKAQLVPLVSKAYENRGKLEGKKLPEHVKAVTDNRQTHFKLEKVLFGDHVVSQTRAYIKIQDGCNNFCSYCQIPYARGKSKSVPPDDVVAQVKDLVKRGIKEVILTGIDIGDYGYDFEGAENFSEAPFESLLTRVFSETDVFRLRISSMEPMTVTESFIKLLAQHKERLCDHFHLPLQAGSDRILTLMRRSYTKKEFAETLAKIREYFPEAMISADVIPGFPSETDAEFEETMRFITDCKIDFLHVFPYSPRPNTSALRMPGHLDPAKIKVRAKALRELSDKTRQKFYEQYIGQTVEVLWEQKSKEFFTGKTRNYLDVVAEEKEAITSGTTLMTEIKAYDKKRKALVGELF